MKNSRLSSSVPNTDARYRNVKVDTSMMQELSSFVPNERDYSTDADCYISSVTNVTEVQSPPPLFSSPSLVPDDDDDVDERNNKIQSIIGMLTSDIGCSPIQAVHQKITADKSTETSFSWDLGDIDYLLLQELQLDPEPASASSVVPEALISQPSSVPVYSNPIDMVPPVSNSAIDTALPPTISRFHHANYHNNTPFTSSSSYCRSGNCSHCCFSSVIIVIPLLLLYHTALRNECYVPVLITV